MLVAVAAPVHARPAAADTSTTPHGGPTAADSRLDLVDQAPFDVAPDTPVTFVLDLPTGLLTEHPEATLVITAHRPVETRAGVAEALTGELPRSGDTVDIKVVDIVTIDGDRATVVIPTETTTRRTGELQLPQAGLYPVVVELQDRGNVLAELVTFLHRLPGAGEPTEAPLQVAFAMRTTSPVVLDDATDVVLSAGAVAELARLADVLEVGQMPVAVQIPPALLLALAASDDDGAALAARLRDGLANSDVLSMPRYPLDPSLAAAAEQQLLYTQWLRNGEDDLAAAVGNPSVRTLAFLDESVSEGGAALLRDLGARLAVMTPAVFDALPRSTGIFTDLSLLVQLQVAPNVTIDATVTDRVMGPILARPTATPALTGIAAAAHLLTYRQEIIDAGGDPRRHGITLSTPSLSLPNVDTFRAISTAIANTADLAPGTLDTLGIRTDYGILNDAEVVVGLPEAVRGSLTERVQLVNSLTLQAISTGSMLPPDDARVASWQSLIDLLPTSALSDTQVDELADDLRSEYAAVRDAIEAPEGFSFTLTGRRTTVPLKLRNNSDIPLTVRVRMTSSKLLFPDGDQLVVLLPQEFTDVRVAIEARTNGDFPVTLEVFTPIGDVLLAPPVPLRASVNALSGLGNLITGALLLVVLSWWFRHMRRQRRTRAAEQAAVRHPVSGNGNGSPEGAPISGTALSPDAATSTLPPL